MAFQTVFERYEVKYLLTVEQKAALLQAMEPHMQLDQYGRTTIRNIYFDTDNYRLIRHSLEKPAYKEKLRIRSYSVAEPEDPVFVELKKKYDSVVYKRRVVMPQHQAMGWLCDGATHPDRSQITDEIDYFCTFYQNLRPTVFLSYDREAYYCVDGTDFRVTFDENILSRRENLSLAAPIGGASLLPEGMVLLELKTPGGIPLWMSRFLSRQQIFKTSFSKYGTAYRDQIFSLNKGEHNHV